MVLICISLVTYDVEHFYVVIYLCIVVQTFCPFFIALFFLLASFESLGYRPFIGYVICKCFLPMFSKEQTFLILAGSDLVIFSFMDHAVDVVSKKF